MFERFTDRARRVIVLAQEASRELNHHHIGAEHLLLALLREGEGVAAQALKRHGLTDELLLAQVLETSPRGPSPVSGHVPFTPKAKKLMELALREALQLGHNYIGTEHLMLGVCRDAAAVGVDELAPGVPVNELRKTVLDIIGVPPSGRAENVVKVEARLSPEQLRQYEGAFNDGRSHRAKFKTFNAHLQDLVREIDARAVTSDVLDFERTTSERPTTEAGIYTETITIRWRRREVTDS